MIDASMVQVLYFQALKRRATGLAAMALDAIEHGKDCKSWAKCERIINEQEIKKRGPKHEPRSTGKEEAAAESPLGVALSG